MVTYNFIFDDHVAWYAAIFKKLMFSRPKMVAYPVTWSSESKIDVFNKLLDPDNQLVDEYI